MDVFSKWLPFAIIVFNVFTFCRAESKSTRFFSQYCNVTQLASRNQFHWTCRITERSSPPTSEASSLNISYINAATEPSHNSNYPLSMSETSSLFETKTSSENYLSCLNISVCDETSRCLNITTKSVGGLFENITIHDVKYSSTDRDVKIGFNSSIESNGMSKVLGNIRFEENSPYIQADRQNCANFPSKGNNGTLKCEPRKIFISWSNVRSYMVHNRIASIPGTWIGEPLEVQRCRDFLCPCRGAVDFFCGVQSEKIRVKEMDIALIDNLKKMIAKLFIYFVEDNECVCKKTKQVVDDIEHPPYIFNVSVVRYY